MRPYLDGNNLKKAVPVGAVIALSTMPRVLEGGLPVGPSFAGMLTGMILLAGMATAWGHRAGLPGLWPPKAIQVRWAGLSVLLGFALFPIGLAFDPLHRSILAQTGSTEMLALACPRSGHAILALMLWSAGFETLFFCAAPMAFTARLTGSRAVAIGAPALFHLLVGIYQFNMAGVTKDAWILLLGIVVVRFITCILYARGGLPAAALLGFVLEARHFLALS